MRRALVLVLFVAGCHNFDDPVAEWCARHQDHPSCNGTIDTSDGGSRDAGGGGGGGAGGGVGGGVGGGGGGSDAGEDGGSDAGVDAGSFECVGAAVRPCFWSDGGFDRSDAGVCRTGLQACNDGGWTACSGAVLPASSEACQNFQDDDCDGVTDCTGDVVSLDYLYSNGGSGTWAAAASPGGDLLLTFDVQGAFTLNGNPQVNGSAAQRNLVSLFRPLRAGSMVMQPSSSAGYEYVSGAALFEDGGWVIGGRYTNDLQFPGLNPLPPGDGGNIPFVAWGNITPTGQGLSHLDLQPGVGAATSSQGVQGLAAGADWFFMGGFCNGPFSYDSSCATGGSSAWVAGQERSGGQSVVRKFVSSAGSAVVRQVIATPTEIIAAGEFQGTLTLATDGTVNVTSNGQQDIFVARIPRVILESGTSGTKISLTAVGSTSNDFFSSVAATPSGTVAVAALAAAPGTLGPNSACSGAAISGGFVAVMSSAACHAVKVPPGSNGNPWIGFGKNGELVAAGSFSAPFNFGQGNVPSAGGSDVYVAIFDSSGAPLSHQILGSSGNDYSQAMAAAAEQLIVIVSSDQADGAIAGFQLDAGNGSTRSFYELRVRR